MTQQALQNTFRFLANRFVDNIKFDIQWLSLALPTPYFEKYSYLFKKYYAVLANKRRISYLGKPFSYDNRLSPALLQTYPSEIEELARQMKLKEIVTVFDVGANVGQFAWTLKSYFPHLNVYSFEPNPTIFPLLEKNAKSLSGWRACNFGIGPERTTIPFYFVQGKSGQGSVFKKNSMLNLQPNSVESLSIAVQPLDAETQRVEKLPAQVDLLKIDVEGFELEALKGLKQVAWKYLYVEVSEGRDGAVSLEAVRSTVEALWNKRPDLIWEGDTSQPARNILFRMPD
jgi:FkbM family methyltransferase